MSITELGPSSYRARVRYRNGAGRVRYVARFAETAPEAERRLEAALVERAPQSSGSLSLDRPPREAARVTSSNPQPSELDEIALAVGHVAMNAAWLENFAGILASILIGSPRADIFVFGQGWAGIYDGLRALLNDRIREASDDGREGREIDVPFYRQTLAHLKDANELMKKRGNIVHAVWSAPDDEGIRESITYKRWGRFNASQMRLTELHRLSQDLRTKMIAVYEATERIAGPNDD